MKIFHGREQNAKSESRGPTFTGQVWADPVMPTTEGVTINNVFFTPGARTFWHTHAQGQILQVTAGKGWICVAGQKAEVIRVGDVEELHAATRRVKPGGTILLADGVYPVTRTVVIATDRVTLRGESGQRGNVVLDGGGGEVAVFLADVVPTQWHVPLPWIMGYDVEPLVTLESKRALLGRAADEGWLVVFEHDAHVAAGRIARDGKGLTLVGHDPPAG